MKIKSFQNIYRVTVITFFLLSQCSFCLTGQSSKNTTQLLSKIIKNNTDSIPYAENIDFIQNNKQEMPLLNEINFRTESDEMEFELQRYQVRFKFNTMKERQSAKEIINNKKLQYEIRQNSYLLDKLEEANIDIVKLYYTKREIQLQKEELLLLQDKKNIYNKLINNGSDFDVDKWLSNEKNILEITTKLIKNKSLSNDLKCRLLKNDTINITLQFDDWLSVYNLRLLVNDSAVNSNMHPNYAMNKAKEEEATAEYEFEKDQAKEWLDFLQFEYKGNDKLLPNKEFSLGMGIIIPFKSFSRIKVNNAYLELMESKYETQTENEEAEKNLFETYAKLDRLFMEYDLFQEFKEKQKTQETYDTYLKSPSLSPLFLINIKQVIISQEKKNLMIEKEIYLTYIKLLSQSGILIQIPLRNYLNNELSLIDF
ncbi:MAG: hypothetical protein K8R54_13715 [Bacteroidales bacterium]|nr:hypothetical protein [Bacteroidales bacterium]